MEKSRLDDGTVLVAFELPAAVAATSVSLCADFNDWSPVAHPLALLDDGRFRIEVRLPAGQRFRFRYLLDGERWENDWAADAYLPNGLGTDDSMVDLTAVAPGVAATVGAASVAELAGSAGEVTGDVTGELAGDVTGELAGSAAGGAAAATDEPAGTPAEAAPKHRWWRFWGRRQLAPAGEGA